MARNLTHTNSVVRSIQDDTSYTRQQNDVFISLFKKQQEDNQKMRSYIESKIPNIKDYFPLKDDAAIDRFFDKSDGQFELRRSEFYNMLCQFHIDKENLFATSLLRSCFSKKIIKTHTWPGPW